MAILPNQAALVVHSAQELVVVVVTAEELEIAVKREVAIVVPVVVVVAAAAVVVDWVFGKLLLICTGRTYVDISIACGLLRKSLLVL